jgi:hypothetical protein
VLTAQWLARTARRRSRDRDLRAQDLTDPVHGKVRVES